MDTNEKRVIQAMAHEMRIEMARKGWKQQELADMVGIARESMSRYLSGKKAMPIGTPGIEPPHRYKIKTP